jgi:NTP pyrophosphatase (non-canonical NTP hydrolase)
MASKLTPEDQFVVDVLLELKRARAKFPSAFACGLATMEEAGELAQALLKHAAGKWPQSRIREEAVQVAVMAMRCALEGDASLGGHQYTEPGE